MMDTVTYIMVMMVSNEGIQEAVPLTVHSCPYSYWLRYLVDYTFIKKMQG